MKKAFYVLKMVFNSTKDINTETSFCQDRDFSPICLKKEMFVVQKK